MKLISKLTGVFNRWRQRVDEIQYHDGYHWAKDVYFRGDLSFQALLDAATPVTCAFERGVMQAVIDIERDNNPEPEVNVVGEPVGVPFFVEMVPGHKDRPYTIEEMLDEFKQKKGELRTGL